MLRAVDDVTVGRALRALRIRRRLSQGALGELCGLSQSAISLMEHGHWEALSVRAVRGAFAALDARFETGVTWRGGRLDRLLDERHAGLVAAAVALLEALGWTVFVEVTFSEYGERGSIDILAVQRSSRVALVIEVKATIESVDETVRRLDVKHRLAPRIVFEREGWRPSTVGRMLVVREGSTNRRRIAAHWTVFEAAFPARGAAVRAWLRRPSGGISGLLFSSSTNPRGR